MNEGFEHIPELSVERKLEIAIAYIKDDAERLGKQIPNFNSVEMRERVQQTIKGRNLSEANVTEAEAVEFLRQILS